MRAIHTHRVTYWNIHTYIYICRPHCWWGRYTRTGSHTETYTHIYICRPHCWWGRYTRTGSHTETYTHIYIYVDRTADEGNTHTHRVTYWNAHTYIYTQTACPTINSFAPNDVHHPMNAFLQNTSTLTPHTLTIQTNCAHTPIMTLTMK